MKQSTFQAALKFASHAAATKDVRYYLNGVFFEFGQGGIVTMVATDGHRMAVIEVQSDHGNELFGFSTIIAIADVKLLLAMSKDKVNSTVAFIPDGDMLRIGGGSGWAHACKGIYGRYPDWRRVARITDQPTPQARFKVNANYLSDAAKACAALTDRGLGVTFTNYGEGQSFRVAPAPLEKDGVIEAYAIVMPMRG